MSDDPNNGCEGDQIQEDWMEQMSLPAHVRWVSLAYILGSELNLVNHLCIEGTIEDLALFLWERRI